MVKQILIHIAMAIIATVLGTVGFLAFVNHLSNNMSDQSQFLNAEEMLSRK